MRTKKELRPMSERELQAMIDRIIEIRPLANEYRSLCQEVKGDLQARGIDTYTTPGGNTANVNRKPGVMWLLEGLKKIFTRALLDTYCPRRADTKKLNQRLAATSEDKRLAKCRVDTPGKLELEVLAKGETAVVSNVSDADDVEEAA